MGIVVLLGNIAVLVGLANIVAPERANIAVLAAKKKM